VRPLPNLGKASVSLTSFSVMKHIKGDYPVCCRCDVGMPGD
jgi:hypothetical protein